MVPYAVPKESCKLGGKDKLLEKARKNPQNLRFDELCTLAESFDFVRRKNSSGHRVYKRNSEPKITITIQDLNGKAKPYQVKQLIRALEDAGLI